MGRWTAADEAASDSDLPSRPEDHWLLLATAVRGAPVALSPSSDLYTDGHTIFFDPATLSPDGLALQAALLSIDSFSGATIGRLAARPKVRSRYLLLEGLRAATELVDVLPPRTLRRILATCDRAAPRTSQESLELATSGASGVPEAPEWMGVIRPARLARAGLNGAVRRSPRAGQAGVPVAALAEADEDARESDPPKLLRAPGAPRNPIAEYLQRLLGAGRSSSGAAAGGDEMHVAEHRAAVRRSSQGAAVDPATTAPGLSFPAAPHGHLHPEWDFNRQIHRQDWCVVGEFSPDTDEGRFTAPLDPRLRRELARIGIVPERHRRQHDGDTLDLDAVIDRRVARRVGRQADDDPIHEQHLRTARDLGVLLLLDATGSTGESEEGRKLFDLQRSVVVALATEFEALGVRVAVYAFRSWGRRNVQFLRIKRYDDRYDSAAEHRLHAIEPGGFTRIGAAVRHGTYVAKRDSGAASDLLLVIGDGLPYDDGYEGRYAQEDTRRALTDAVSSGVAAACLGVCSTVDPAILEKAWGSVAYGVLGDPKDLAPTVARLLRGALKTAAASRRQI